MGPYVRAVCVCNVKIIPGRHTVIRNNMKLLKQLFDIL